MTDLVSTMTVREIAAQAAEAIRALNHLAAEAGELTDPGEVRDIIASLERMSHGLPPLCEQLARFLVAQHEDRQIVGDAREVIGTAEALTAAGQAADMLAAALDEARSTSERLSRNV